MDAIGEHDCPAIRRLTRKTKNLRHLLQPIRILRCKGPGQDDDRNRKWQTLFHDGSPGLKTLIRKTVIAASAIPMTACTLTMAAKTSRSPIVPDKPISTAQAKAARITENHAAIATQIASLNCILSPT